MAYRDKNIIVVDDERKWKQYISIFLSRGFYKKFGCLFNPIYQRDIENALKGYKLCKRDVNPIDCIINQHITLIQIVEAQLNEYREFLALEPRFLDYNMDLNRIGDLRLVYLKIKKSATKCLPKLLKRLSKNLNKARLILNRLHLLDTGEYQATHITDKLKQLETSSKKLSKDTKRKIEQIYNKIKSTLKV